MSPQQRAITSRRVRQPHEPTPTPRQARDLGLRTLRELAKPEQPPAVRGAASKALLDFADRTADESGSSHTDRLRAIGEVWRLELAVRLLRAWQRFPRAFARRAPGWLAAASAAYTDAQARAHPPEKEAPRTPSPARPTPWEDPDA